MTPSLKLMTFALLLGAATVGACGDDGNVLGTDGGAGTAGQSSGGSGGTEASGTAGSSLSTAGTSAAGKGSGGSASGGSANSGAGNGGTSSGSCDIAECLRANVCLDKCGGKVVYSGCCACPAATVEEQSCLSSAGGQGTGGGSAQDCVGMTCGAGEACVAHRTVGGAVIPPSGAGCMTGRHLENGSCQNDFNYACAALTCSGIGPSCRCAPNTSCAYTTTCMLPKAAAWLDTDAELVCEQQVP